MVRSLGRAGVEVEVYSSRSGSVAGRSRYCRHERNCPPQGDASRFLPWLEAALESGEIELVAPTSDLLAYYISRVQALLPPGADRALPDPDAVLDALFKDRFHRACLAHGQAVPWQKTPCSTDDALEGARHYPYPIVLKPRSHVAVPLARGKVVGSPEELRQHYRAYAVEPGQHGLAERHPEQRWPVLQAYVPDALGNLYSISGMLDDSGQPLAVSLCQKTSQWPPTLGVGTVFESREDPGLQDQGTRLAQQLLGRGLFELELILDADGRALAVDLNPRVFGQIALNVARGHDLPLLWYRLSCGQSPAPAAAPRAEVCWRHAVPFHIDQGLQLWHARSRRMRLQQYLGELRRPHVDIVHELSDPLPGLTFTAKMLRHPRALLRSLSRARQR